MSCTLYATRAQASWYVLFSLDASQTLIDGLLIAPGQMHPPLMDTVTVTAMLYRFVVAFGL